MIVDLELSFFTMPYFEDLSPWTCFEPFLTAEKLRAVGWLAWGHPFKQRQTDLSESHFRKLLQLLKHPWEPLEAAGDHECEFCVEAKDFFGRSYVKRYGLVIYFGSSNLFVPGDNCIYVAPSMIAHYIEAHAYEPPPEFWEAVLSCPEMRSEPYKKALMRNGPTGVKLDLWPLA